MKYEDFDERDFEPDENDDVLCRVKHENGTIVTFLTAPASVFTEQDELEPLVYGICEGEVCVAFNVDVVERMIKEGVLTNGETYGMAVASLLPMTLILRTGCKEASKFIMEHEENKGS